MNSGLAQRVAERFASLSIERRRLLYAQVRSQGMALSQLPILPCPAESNRQLSAAQLRQWFLWQLDKDSTAYHISVGLRLRGPVDEGALRSAFAALVSRHDSLRTVFQTSEEDIVEQVIQPSGGFALLELDATSECSDFAETRAAKDAARIANTPFDLTTGPLFRVGLIRLSPEERVLVAVLHHIVSDGWSMQIIMDEFVELYRAHVEGRRQNLKPLPVKYADYAAWQRNWLEAGEQERQLAYWKAQLGDEHPVLRLLTDYPRPAEPKYRAAHYSFELPAHLIEGLQRQAREHRATMFIVLLAGFQALLHRYTGLSDIRVGTNSANRHRPEIQGVVGFFINAQVIRSQVDGRMSLEALLTAVREAVVGAQEHQDLPFEQLVDALQPERSLRHPPLFQVLMNHQRRDDRELGQLPGLSLQRYGLGEQAAKFELMLSTVERTDGRVSGSFTYAAELFAPQTIARLGEHYLKVLTALAAHPSQRIGAVDLLDHAEGGPLRQRDIRDRHALPSEAACQMIEQRARQAPDMSALVVGEKVLSYAELSARTNRLARRLTSLGVSRETRVGVHAPRSIEFVVGVLAVWKVGGVYVPLDPQLPEERLAYQFKDSGARVLLSTGAVGWAGEPVVDPAAADAWNAEDEASHLPLPEIHPAQAAYVIYTSGSTGQPQGVVVSHGALSSYVQAVLETLALPEDLRNFAMVSTVAADLGHTVLFGALCSGRTLHLVSQDCAFDPDRFASYMRDHQIEVLKIAPSHLRGLLSASNPEDVLPRHTLLLGGEATSWSLLDHIHELAPECRVINHYGPTETTVGVLTHDSAQERLENAGTLPIGLPLPNTQGYVLDAYLNPTPQGVPGELYIGGSGLAQGYQGRSDLTVERFVASPFTEGERLYRTGDQVRVLKDGSVEFLGRTDEQVKVRGYRVELREIAHTLKAQQGVRDAEVISRTSEDGSVQLHGYVVPERDITLDVKALQEQLSALLPEYMVPNAIVVLESLPITPNGKVDRKALPEPGRILDCYDPPQGEIENALAGVWAKVLRIERIGRHDNFFQLGGDSIHCLQIVARSRAAGLMITLDQMFECQTIARLGSVAETVVTAVTDEPSNQADPSALTQMYLEGLPVPAEQIDDVYPMTSMQQGMLLHTFQNPRSGMYVIQSHYRLDTAIDVPAFENAWSQVLQRHAALRTAFIAKPDGAFVQVVHRHVKPPVEYLDWSELPQEDTTQRIGRLLSDEIERGFDLAEPSLFRVRLIRTGERQFEVTQLCHHILLDAWCWSLIWVDFFDFYNAHRMGAPIVRPPPRPYRDFVLWLGRQDPDKTRRYWQGVLSGFDAATPLPMKEHPASVVSSMVNVTVRLSEERTRRLQDFAQEHHITVNTIAQGCWALLLSKYSDRRDVLFGVTVAGRPTELEGIQETVGLFVNTIPLRVSVPDRESRTTVVTWLKDLLAQNVAMRFHEHLPLPEIQKLGDMPQGQSLFDSLFVFENAPMDVALGGHAQSIAAHRTRSRTHTNYPITVMVVPTDRLELQIIYEKARFEHSLVTTMAEHFRRLVEECIDQPTADLQDLCMISTSEAAQIVLAGRGNEATADLAGSFVCLFEAQVRQNPSATAVRFGSHSLRYDELNRRANRIGRVLRSHGVREDDLIVVLADRNLDLPCRVLGIFKAGGAYLAFDPGLPPQRLSKTIRSCGARLILTTRSHEEKLRGLLSQLEHPPEVLVDEHDAVSSSDDANLGIYVPADGAAYAIYTSGSTGEPKGVLIASQGMLNNQLSKGPALGLTSTDVIAQTAAQSFDISVWQLLAGLLFGATVEIVPDAIAQDPRRLLEHVASTGITVLESVPSLIQGVLAGDVIPVPTLRCLISTGERMSPALARRWTERYPDVALVNAYGPAECADDVTLYRVDSLDAEQGSSLAIGRAVDNTQLYVLGSRCDLLPDGAIGELYVGGVGVGPGYLGQSGHTAERFVANPFAESPGCRMYRTGDLVRRRPDRVLEYHGRVDQQIKIRGFRIEIGEIEAQLARVEGVQQSAVGVHMDAGGDPRLVGYLVPLDPHLRDATPETQSDYRRALRLKLLESLPDYMVPAIWMVLESLPLTSSGKLDRRKLPKPDPVQMQKSYEPPEGELEELIAAIWRQALGVERVSRSDSFFELGGHSLLAMKVAAQVQAASHMRVQVTDVFEAQTLERLAARVALNKPIASQRALEDVDAFMSTLEAV